MRRHLHAGRVARHLVADHGREHVGQRVHAVFRELDGSRQRCVLGFNGRAPFLRRKVHERAECGRQFGALFCKVRHTRPIAVQECPDSGPAVVAQVAQIRFELAHLRRFFGQRQIVRVHQCQNVRLQLGRNDASAIGLCAQLGNHVAQLLVVGPLGLVQADGHDVFGANHLHHLRKRFAREIDAAAFQLLHLRGDRIRRIKHVGVGFVQAEQLELRRDGARVVVIAERSKRHVNGALVKLGRQRGERGFRGAGVVQCGGLTQLHHPVNDGLGFSRIRVAFLDAGALAHEELQRGAAVRGFQAARVLQERHAAFGLRLQQQLRFEFADHFLHQLLHAERKVHDLGAQDPQLFGGLFRLAAAQVLVQLFHELRRHLVRRGIDDAAQRRQKRGHAANVQLHRHELLRVLPQVVALQRQQVADFALHHRVLVHVRLDPFGNGCFFQLLYGAPRLHGLALQLVRNAGHVADAAHVFLAQQRVAHEGPHAPGLRLAGFQRRNGRLNGHRQKRERGEQQRRVHEFLERGRALFLHFKFFLGHFIVLLLAHHGGIQRGHGFFHDEFAQRVQVHAQVVAHGRHHVGNHAGARVVVFFGHRGFHGYNRSPGS